jgi:hypothetical protein
VSSCVYDGETRDPEALEVSEELLEQILSDPDAFLDPCEYEHWEQQDYFGKSQAFRTTIIVENGDLRFNTVRMPFNIDGTPLFELGGHGWVEEDRVEIADRYLTGYICADGSGQFQFAPDEGGPEGVCGMSHFEDAQAFDDLQGLLARIRERAMQILRYLSF